jgi:hypothetical protein
MKTILKQTTLDESRASFVGWNLLVRRFFPSYHPLSQHGPGHRVSSHTTTKPKELAPMWETISCNPSTRIPAYAVVGWEVSTGQPAPNPSKPSWSNHKKGGKKPGESVEWFPSSQTIVVRSLPNARRVFLFLWFLFPNGDGMCWAFALLGCCKINKKAGTKT